MRIAILQRDPVMRQSIEKILMSASHTCMVYDDGLTLSKALARSTVDMLVLDWHGTRLSGAEVLRSVRAVGGDRLPVLFASTETSEDSVVRAFASGADDYIGLPLRPGEFRERVAALLRRAYPDRLSAASFDVGPYRCETTGRNATPKGSVPRLTIEWGVPRTRASDDRCLRCFTRDEGRFFGVGLQGQAPNHHELRG